MAGSESEKEKPRLTLTVSESQNEGNVINICGAVRMADTVLVEMTDQYGYVASWEHLDVPGREALGQGAAEYLVQLVYNRRQNIVTSPDPLQH